MARNTCSVRHGRNLMKATEEFVIGVIYSALFYSMNGKTAQHDDLHDSVDTTECNTIGTRSSSELSMYAATVESRWCYGKEIKRSKFKTDL